MFLLEKLQLTEHIQPPCMLKLGENYREIRDTKQVEHIYAIDFIEAKMSIISNEMDYLPYVYI